MKTLEILNDMRIKYNAHYSKESNQVIKLHDAIYELENILKEKVLLEEYVQFARLHIETYRCKCGSLGRVGYLCSNKECSEV